MRYKVFFIPLIFLFFYIYFISSFLFWVNIYRSGFGGSIRWKSCTRSSIGFKQSRVSLIHPSYTLFPSLSSRSHPISPLSLLLTLLFLIDYLFDFHSLPCTIVCPEYAPESKLQWTRNYGAEVIKHGTLC